MKGPAGSIVKLLTATVCYNWCWLLCSFPQFIANLGLLQGRDLTGYCVNPPLSVIQIVYLEISKETLFCCCFKLHIYRSCVSAQIDQSSVPQPKAQTSWKHIFWHICWHNIHIWPVNCLQLPQSVYERHNLGQILSLCSDTQINCSISKRTKQSVTQIWVLTMLRFSNELSQKQLKYS